MDELRTDLDPIVILGAGTRVKLRPAVPRITTTPPRSSVLVKPVAGPAGADGAPGGRPDPVTFTGTWSSFYTAHTFPYLPDVWLINQAGDAVEVGTEYPDATHVSISFPVPFTGKIVIG